MPYIGKQLVRGQNRKLDDISSGFNGSQTTFTLQVASQNVTVGSALQLWISLGGVIQEPTIDYTIAGNQITFTTAPAASLDFFGVIQGDVTDTNTPGDATVTTSKLSTGLTVNLADGSAATSSLQLGGTDSGLFSSAADKVNVTTGGVERLEIGDSEVVFNDPSNDVDFRVESNGNANMLFVDGGNDRVGIATGSPSAPFHLNAGTTNNALFVDSSDAEVSIGLAASDGSIRLLQSSKGLVVRTNGNANAFGTGDSEALRVDSGGRLLVGTSSSYGIADQVQIVSDTGINLHRGSSNTGAARLDLSKSRNTTYGSNTIVQSGDTLGSILFRGDDGTNYTTPGGEIKVEVDGTPGANDMPGRLVFSTTADGASSTTERMRIDNSGRLLVNNSSSTNGRVVIEDTSFQVSLETGTSGDGRLQIGHFAAGAFIGTYGDDGGAADIIRFGTHSGDERMRIDSSGNVGIGTSSPSSYVGGGENLVIAESGDAGLTIATGTSNTGTINFADGTSGDARYRGRLEYSHSLDALDILTAASTRMRISSTGFVHATNTGSISASNYHSFTSNVNTYRSLGVENSSNASGDGTYYSFLGSNANNTSSYHFVGAVAGVDKVLIYGNGNIVNVNNSYTQLSDIKLKENIVDANSQWNDLKALQIRNWNFKEETGHGTHTQIGVVAQEIETVSPGLVDETTDRDEDGNDLGTVTKIVKYSVLYMKAVKALQEAMERIETLEAKVAALEAE